MHTEDWQGKIYVHQTARILLKVENLRNNPPVTAEVTVSLGDGLTIEQAGGDGWNDPSNCRTGCTAVVRLNPDQAQDGENFILVKASEETESTQINIATEWRGDGNPEPQHTEDAKIFSIERSKIENTQMHIQANKTKLTVGEETIITVHIQNAINRPDMNAVAQINIPSGVDKAYIDGAGSCTSVCRIVETIGPGEEKHFTVRITPNETGEMRIENASYWIYEGEERRHNPSQDEDIVITVTERVPEEVIPVSEYMTPTPAAAAQPQIEPEQPQDWTDEGGGTLGQISGILQNLAILVGVVVVAFIVFKVWR